MRDPERTLAKKHLQRTVAKFVALLPEEDKEKVRGTHPGLGILPLTSGRLSTTSSSSLEPPRLSGECLRTRPSCIEPRRRRPFAIRNDTDREMTFRQVELPSLSAVRARVHGSYIRNQTFSTYPDAKSLVPSY